MVFSIERFQKKLFCYHTALSALLFVALRFPALPQRHGFFKIASFLIHLNSQIFSGCVTFLLIRTRNKNLFLFFCCCFFFFNFKKYINDKITNNVLT